MLNFLAEEDKQEGRITRDPEFRMRNKVIQLTADLDEQFVVDTISAPQLDYVQSDKPVDDIGGTFS